MTDDRASNEPIDPSYPDESETPSIDDAPLGGDETTEDQLDADNAAEEDTLKTLDPGNAPA